MNMMRGFMLLWLALLAGPAFAHQAGTSWLALQSGSEPQLQLDLPLQDVEWAIGLDRNGDNAITWGELREARPALEAYVLARLNIRAASQPCQIQPYDLLFNLRTDGTFATLQARLQCGNDPATGYTVQSRVLADVDQLHKTIVTLKGPQGSASAILSSDRPSQQLALQSQGRWQSFISFLHEGLWHIWLGFDHVLFLLTLLLPAVLVRREGEWRPAPALGDCVRQVALTVTAFTVAHSLTLALATLGLVRLPGQLVEAAIAASVVLVALNNVWPLLHQRWSMTLLFGLLHGFGLAGALSELDLPAGALLLALGGFNVGVELGQLLLVLVLLPVLFYLRHWRLYTLATLRLGSLLIALLGAIWLVERVFNLQLLPAAA